MCKPARSFPRTAQNDDTKLLQFTPISCESIYMPTSSHNTKKMALHNCSSRGNNNSTTIDINHTDPSWFKPLCKRNNSRPQKEVTFCPLVTVHTFPPSFLPSREMLSADSEQQLQKAMTRRKGKDAQDKTTSVNPDSKVRIERRIQQRTAIMAVLSYQRRLQERIAGVAPSFEFPLLLSPTSLKLSQRAKDIALETARQTFLEVYPLSASASDMVPIHVSEFPEIRKKKKKREHPGNFVCNPPPKRNVYCLIHSS